MDLYTRPAGSANPTEHYHVHIDSNHVFWMVRVPRESVIVRLDDGRARLRVCGLKVFDDHDIANPLTQGLGLPGDLGFPYPARVS